METNSLKLVGIGVLGVVIGYFIGREHMKYEIRSAMEEVVGSAFSGFGRSAATEPTAATLATDVRKTQSAEYAKNLAVYDFRASMMNSVLEGRVPGLEFKLKNIGDKTASKVKVTVYFKDAGGNTISEEDYFPVNADSILGGGPLKPGYVWQQEKGKFYMAKTVPSEWKEGAATIAVTEVELAD